LRPAEQFQEPAYREGSIEQVHPDPQLEQAERRVKALAKQFPEILAGAANKSSIQIRMARVGAEIQRCVNT